MRRKDWIGIAFVAAIVCLVGAMAVTTPSPGKISLGAYTTMYFDMDTIDGETADTLLWGSDRSFTDTAYWTAVFVTPISAVGDLQASILDDSTIIVASDSVDTDKTYYYMVVRKKH